MEDYSEEKKLRTAMVVTVYGVSVLALRMIFYALEGRHRHFVLAFGICCILSSIYGFISGVWPFGIVKLAWSMVAFRRWTKSRTQERA